MATPAETAQLHAHAIPVRTVDSPAWARFLSVVAWPAVLGLVSVGAAFLVLEGRGNLAVAGIAPAAAVAAVVWLLRAAPADSVRRVPDTARATVEARRLLLYTLAYTACLVPLAFAIKLIPVPILPGVINTPVLSALNVMGDKVLLLGLPALLFARAFGGVRRQLGLHSIRGSRRWLAPAAAIAVLIAWQGILAWPHAHSLSLLSAPALLAVSLIYAGLPEEIYYRGLLQTRLEIVLGTRPGIAVTAFLFGLRHVPVRYLLIWLGTTASPGFDLLLALSVMLCVQTTFGLAFGYMWSRYRNMWLNVGGHTLYDFLNFVAMLA
jgi:membrane protease YdiL (CAAX protease family)